MVIVRCPYCGEELRYEVTMEDCGDVEPSYYPNARGECKCTYHDDNSDLSNALLEFVKARLFSYIRALIKNTEIR